MSEALLLQRCITVVLWHEQKALTCEELISCQAVAVQQVQVAWEGQVLAEAAHTHTLQTDAVTRQALICVMHVHPSDIC